MVKMKMFGFMQQQQKAAPKPAPAASGGKGSTPGKMFDMKNLGAIMKVKSTGCKSCGG